MIEHNKKASPQKDEYKRRTTLSLTPELWSWLKGIEEETGARPSVIVRRALQKIQNETTKGKKP